ncbi:unnamed protein product, partial [Prorocentrum cordatum]
MEELLDGAKELFGYNRENFFFDREQRLKREFQEQRMRVKQFLLYREDVRVLTELTVSKMDSYLLVALVELGACLVMLCHGGINGDKEFPPPTWLLWLYMVSLAEAFLHLILSAWLAIHASVAANSFTVRMLTQFVRLPLPNKFQLDAASAFATQFEEQGPGAFFRVPVLQQQAQARAPGLFGGLGGSGSSQVTWLRVAGAGGVGARGNGVYRAAGGHAGRTKYQQVDGAWIIYHTKSGWKINDEDDTQGWIYKHADKRRADPPEGPWTTDGYTNGDADPPPCVTHLQAAAPASPEQPAAPAAPGAAPAP